LLVVSVYRPAADAVASPQEKKSVTLFANFLRRGLMMLFFVPTWKLPALAILDPSLPCLPGSAERDGLIAAASRSSGLLRVTFS
jgi:hypothetical protein